MASNLTHYESNLSVEGLVSIAVACSIIILIGFLLFRKYRVIKHLIEEKIISQYSLQDDCTFKGSRFSLARGLSVLLAETELSSTLISQQMDLLFADLYNKVGELVLKQVNRCSYDPHALDNLELKFATMYLSFNNTCSAHSPLPKSTSVMAGLCMRQLGECILASFFRAHNSAFAWINNSEAGWKRLYEARIMHELTKEETTELNLLAQMFADEILKTITLLLPKIDRAETRELFKENATQVVTLMLMCFATSTSAFYPEPIGGVYSTEEVFLKKDYKLDTLFPAFFSLKDASGVLYRTPMVYLDLK